MKTTLKMQEAEAPVKVTSTPSLGLTPEELAYNEIPERVQYVNHSSFASPATEEQLYGESAQQIEIPDWTHFPEVAEDVPVARSKRHGADGQG